jgi:hypothetical protein
MSEANEERGEVSLALGARSFKLRPSYTALRAVEKKSGRSLMELARLANKVALPLPDLAIVATEMIRAGAGEDDLGAKAASPDKIEEMIFEEGVAAVSPTLFTVLFLAATGGVTASGEIKAVAAKPGSTTAA